MGSIMMFIGGYYDDQYENELVSNKDQLIQSAANEFQKKLINGFKKNNVVVDVYSMPFIKHFTLKNKTYNFSRKTKFIKDEDITLNYISFNNLFGYKSISRKRNLLKKVKELNEENYFENIDHIYIYSAHTPFLYLAKWVKENHPEITITLNILDLPEFMNLSRTKFLYKILKKYDTNKVYKLMKYIDKFILITEETAKVVNAEDYLVVEGISSMGNELQKDTSMNMQNNGKKIITYTGTLHKKFGIEYLINSFLSLNNDNIELHLAGEGDFVPEIKRITKTNTKIIYHGKISVLESKSLQDKSDILVNPRMVDKYTKYSFPSKLIEYIETGNPVISAKLQGIPNEYDDYMFYFDPTSEKCNLTMVLDKVINMEEKELSNLRIINKTFIQEEKNNVVVTKKILDYICVY